MQPPDISESEWAVMETLWQSAPHTASEITRTLRPTRNWAENTVRTLLTRLVDKGALQTKENASGTRIFSPAVRREACVGAESESFMQRVFSRGLEAAFRPLRAACPAHRGGSARVKEAARSIIEESTLSDLSEHL